MPNARKRQKDKPMTIRYPLLCASALMTALLASRITDAGIALPVAWHVSPDDASFIARTFREILAQENA